VPFSDVVKLFTNSFSTTQFLPALLASLAGVWGLPLIVHGDDPLQPIKKVLTLASTEKAVLAVAVAVVLSVVFTILSTTLLRVYEGYIGHRLFWAPLRASELRRRRQTIEERDRLKALGDRTPAQQQRLNSLALAVETRFARSDRATMATSLGNVYRAFEGYPNDRYHFDGVVMWPRIYPLLPESARADVSAAQSRIDLLITSTTLSYLAALIVVWLEPFSLRTALLVATLTVGGYVAYRGAVTAALSMGMAVRASFDIGRKTLLESLGLKLPESLEEERELWRRLTDFLLYNKPGLRPKEEDPPGSNDVAKAGALLLIVAAIAWALRRRTC